MTFTDLENRVMEAALESSDGNGHDFGYTEDIIENLKDVSPQALGGVITSLEKKEFFEYIDSDGVQTDSGFWHQFSITETYINEWSSK